MALTGKIMDFFADRAMTIPAFPRTKVKAVSDDNNVGLDALLNSKANATHTHTANDVGAVPKILTSEYFGTSLPAAGTTGRVFFKKVSS